MLMQTDYYKVLEVSENASAEDIKKSFRRLAKRYHPDRNKGDKISEQKFKEISEAYNTLSDPKKKSEYDTMQKYGAFAGAGGPNAGWGSFSGGFNPNDFAHIFRQGKGGKSSRVNFNVNGMDGAGSFEDILSSIFGGGTAQQSSPFGKQHSQNPKGADINSELTISFWDAVNGATKMIALGNTGKKLRVKIPRGIADGEKIRLAGQGQPAYYGANNGANNGDLIITVKIMPDQNFERKGNDIYTSVTISFVEAIKGVKTKVKTLTKTVMLSVPPGTQPGATMRLKGQGLAVGSDAGDLYVEIKVAIPQTITPKQQQLLDDWEK